MAIVIICCNNKPQLGRSSKHFLIMIKIRRRTQHEHVLPQGLHPVLQRVYCARGINSTNELERGLSHLLPYHTLKGIDQAVACLYQALQKNQHIMVIGDFDADGATSTAVAITALKNFGAKRVSYLVPNRFAYGYGLSPEIVQAAAASSPDLIITVDNGIASHAGVNLANSLGIEVLITDHHLPGDSLPAAVAIVNPNQPGDLFPSKSLAGVGVIFYLMLAFRAYLRELGWFANQGLALPNMAELLDLVALGTVADVVPLDKNNRILVHQGLLRIRAGQSRPGIMALLEIAKRDAHKITASDLGFAIGPRLNAAGRLDDMSLGIACLLAEQWAQARTFAQTLDELNQERRLIEADMQQQAFSVLDKLQLKTQGLPLGLCMFDEHWHQGVIGILASRLKDQFHRPVIAFALANEHELKGSARSIAGIHIRDVLDTIANQHPTLIQKFGGHAMAAGLSISKHNLAAFSQAFAEEVAKQVTEAQLCGEIFTDGELAADEVNLELAELIREAGPWGQSFPEPVFEGKFDLLDQRIVGGKHLKLTLATADMQYDAIAFGIDTKLWPNHRARQISAVYRLDINEFNGRRSVQLVIEHLASLT
jgi:single-stranded-DNA-specific exonuclease